MELCDLRKRCDVETGGCWMWSYATDQDGYGIVYHASHKYRRAHRLSWHLYNGADIPVGMVVMHSCDRPGCVNPEHLSIGTNRDNIQDRFAKGRSARGEANGRAKLRECDVREMRRLRRDESTTYAALGLRFGVALQVAYRAVKGTKWSHVT